MRDRTLILAHQIATFSRIDAKHFKGIDHYLKRARKPKRSGDQSAAVAAMFDRMIEAKGGS